jgi:hypothetical protein
MVRRPRVTVRRLMLAVAIVAIAFGGWGAWVRYRAIVTLSEGYQKRATYFSAFASFSDREALEYEVVAAEKKKTPDPYPGMTLERLARGGASERKVGDYYRALAKKYQQAARAPWIPIEPDPPFAVPE